jgi:TIR domain
VSTSQLLIIIVGAVVILSLAIFYGMRWRRTQSTNEQRRPPDEQRRPRQRQEQRERQTKGIFISYRRDESAGYAGRIADSFEEYFGEDKVFRDIDSIEPGLDFAEAIESAVGSCEVLIAVIGNNWLTATDAAGRKRLEDANDFVRTEIATALKRNIRVIPLLVQGASMPSADELPDDLAPLARRNAFELHDTSWRDDVRRLTGVLKRLIER